MKQAPNHQRYIQVLRQMTPEQRLQKAMELSDMGRCLFAQGLRKRFPDMTEDELGTLIRGCLDRCHNRNY